MYRIRCVFKEYYLKCVNVVIDRLWRGGSDSLNRPKDKNNNILFYSYTAVGNTILNLIACTFFYTHRWNTCRNGLFKDGIFRLIRVIFFKSVIMDILIILKCSLIKWKMFISFWSLVRVCRPLEVDSDVSLCRNYADTIVKRS